MAGPNTNNNNNNNNNFNEKEKPKKSPSISTASSSTTTTKKKKIHDDFSDLMDYIMLDSIEREQHRINVARVHPVIEKNIDGTITVRDDNPTIADIKKIKIR